MAGVFPVPFYFMAATKLLRRGGVDGLSKLPDVLVVVIISLLPFKEAVGTCILSKRWRYLYASISNIVLDFQGEKISDLVSHVDGLFVRRGDHKLFVDKLCILKEVSRHLKPYPMERWLQAVTWHGIRELEIRAPFTFQLPPDLFTNKALEVLKLATDSDDRCFQVPAKVSLPNLKVLHLLQLTFADTDSLNRIVSSCPALEKLICFLWKNENKITVCSSTLKTLALRYLCPKPTDCSGCFDIVADVPNLKFFQITCNCSVNSQSITLGPSLVCVTYDLRFRDLVQSRYFNVAAAIMRSINSTKTLCISDVFMLGLSDFNIPLPIFANMKKLIITHCWAAGLSQLPYFLTHCESLEIIEFWDVEKWSPDQDAWELFFESNMENCVWSRLRKIIFYNFEPGKDQLEMVEFFLRNTWHLELLKIYHLEDETDQRWVSIVKAYCARWCSYACNVIVTQKKN